MEKLEKIIDKEGLTETEVITILKSARGKPGAPAILPIAKRHIKYGYFSDAHIGHEKFIPELFEKMVRHFKQERVEFVLNSGDTLEGMSGRPGHIYELTHVGFQQQISYATELLSTIPMPIYGICGNHDQWFFKKNNGGIIVGEELQARLKNYNHLGQNEGRVKLADKVEILLFHPNDGTAYATSYKLQKLIESFTGGEKPEIVHEGHYHKSLYMFVRNVHGFECGTLCGQSEFMRGKKIPAHTGYGVVDVYFNKQGINRLKHEWVPHYGG